MKSLNQLFALLGAEAHGPVSCEQYLNSLAGARQIANGGFGSGKKGHVTVRKMLGQHHAELTYNKVSVNGSGSSRQAAIRDAHSAWTQRFGTVLKNSLPANEQEKAKQNDAQMNVDGQGKTKLTEIFKLPNGGPGSGRHKNKVNDWFSQGGSLEKQMKRHTALGGAKSTYFDGHQFIHGVEPKDTKKAPKKTMRSFWANAKVANGGAGSGQKGHHPDHPPITNVLANWMYHPETSSYSAERAELEGNSRHDPWGRPLIMRSMKQHTDRENEATHWTGTVLAPPAAMGTLGKPANLTIFND